MSMAPASQGEASFDDQRNTPSLCKSNLADFQQAWPSRPGTCIFISALAIETTPAAALSWSLEPPPGAPLLPASSPTLDWIWRTQISWSLFDSARSCQTRDSVTRSINLFSHFLTSSTSPRSMHPFASDTSPALSSDLK